MPFFECVEDLNSISQKAKKLDAIFITTFTEPLAYGLIKPPGKYNCDICCGEVQSLGIPQGFGEPALGIFTSKMKYGRNMPGRLVGLTKDKQGKKGFLLTLSTDEVLLWETEKK